MIKRNPLGFRIICDQCGKFEFFKTENDFQGFIKAAKQKGWFMFQTTGGWGNHCHECFEKGDEIPF